MRFWKHLRTFFPEVSVWYYELVAVCNISPNKGTWKIKNILFWCVFTRNKNPIHRVIGFLSSLIWNLYKINKFKSVLNLLKFVCLASVSCTRCIKITEWHKQLMSRSWYKIMLLILLSKWQNVLEYGY